jgi:hypothetical protein
LECQLSYKPSPDGAALEQSGNARGQFASQALEERFAIPQRDRLGQLLCAVTMISAGHFQMRMPPDWWYQWLRPPPLFKRVLHADASQVVFRAGFPSRKTQKQAICRISGTCASLAGLEKALTEEGPEEVDLAVKRILLLHFVVMTAGGVPLIYLGDEIATLNDYSYRDDPSTKMTAVGSTARPPILSATRSALIPVLCPAGLPKPARADRAAQGLAWFVRR